MNWTWLAYGAEATAALVAVLAILRALMQPHTADALKNVSITNLTVVVTLALLMVVVLAWVIKCVFLGAPMEPAGVGTILTTLAVFGGVGGGMQIAKRATYTPSPPNTPDIDDAPKTADARAAAAETDAKTLGVPADLSAALRGGTPKKMERDE
jgi:hypothetical protein